MATGSTETSVGLNVVGMDHIVLRVKDVERAIQFYTEVLGLAPHRVEEYREGKVPFPCARVNSDTIIDLFPWPDEEPVGDGRRNPGPLLPGHRADGLDTALRPPAPAWCNRDQRRAGPALGLSRNGQLHLHQRLGRQHHRAAPLLKLRLRGKRRHQGIPHPLSGIRNSAGASGFR